MKPFPPIASILCIALFCKRQSFEVQKRKGYFLYFFFLYLFFVLLFTFLQTCPQKCMIYINLLACAAIFLYLFFDIYFFIFIFLYFIYKIYILHSPGFISIYSYGLKSVDRSMFMQHVTKDYGRRLSQICTVVVLYSSRLFRNLPGVCNI